MRNKSASRILIYLVEELGDARLRAAQLQKYVKDATDLIEKSEHRDAIFEVGAHLIHGIPDTLFKMSKALDASALAVSRLDYEEIKQGLKPEKAEELENVMEDNRLRYLKRRSNEGPMNTRQASEALLRLAAQTRESGFVPVGSILQLADALSSDGRVASQAEGMVRKATRYFREASEAILDNTGERPSRRALAATLRRVAADAILAGAGEEFQKVNPGITDEQVATIDEMHEKHKNVIKDKHAGERFDATVARVLGAPSRLASDEVAEEEKEARFEEGKPADPTQNMSDEDAKKWKVEHDKNKDNFKSASWEA